MAKKRDDYTGELFIEDSGQLRLLDKSAEQRALEGDSVECLGRTFPSDQARREYFLEKLREKLKDPEFRKTPGFPKGTDEDILRLSDPPYYTACPNPFLDEYVKEHGRPFDPSDSYHREPFAVDVSVGKTDPLYKAHGYHTKVPHLAIVPSILHYTKPDDIVLDGFCGSGLTGVAAQFCGAAPSEYRQQVEMQWKKEGREAPHWGARRAILGDLGPAATFIAANYNLPFDVRAFEREAKRILKEVRDEIGWMYETLHGDGKAKGRINYTVWSEVFSCPNCAGDVVFLNEALDTDTKRVRDSFPCPSCGAELDKDHLERIFQVTVDPGTGETWKRIRLEPVLVNYSIGEVKHEKAVDDRDRDVLRRIASLPFPSGVPTNPFPIDEMYHGSRLGPKGFTHVHHLFLHRQTHALAALWRKARAVEDVRLRNMLLFFVEQAIWGMSVLNRYSPSHFSQVNRQLNGVYYVASQHSEVSPWYILDGKLDRLVGPFTKMRLGKGAATVTTGDCAALPIPDDSVDYVFTDPPFGENIYYADLNFLVESWHRVLTDSEPEAIVDQAKHKGLLDYQGLMHRCFAEYHRVLKPGRWMTVVFSNHSNAVWRSIQEALGTAGFVVADVRTLDKQQGSYRQVTSSAVKQDLVISCYKPTSALEQRAHVETVSEESAWAFVREHLANLPVFVARDGEAEIIAERTPQVLLDRMIAFHVQRGLAVPVSSAEYFVGLGNRFPERDGMYFLPDQVGQYDRKRISTTKLQQLSLFPTDEASAIVWIRQQLHLKPQTYQELAPVFMKEIHAWAKHEQTVELRLILEQNFLCYDGAGPVPSQIHSYLSTNFKDLRNLDKEDPALVAKALDRWYVADTSKQGDLEKTREKQLLREFEEYRTTTQRKLKLFRTEAVRGGFKAAYDRQDYQTIIDVARKLPDTVLQEDEKLLMYYDVALTRSGEDA
jgi:16S rRNA G966 N2-methylase RsmD